MIHKLYIALEQGTCVFEKIFYTYLNKETDSQIFTGFISAVGKFASEALGSDLHSICLQTGEQLALIRHKNSGLIGVCIADGKDHDKLLSSMLLKILERFYQKYKKELEAKDASLGGKTKEFEIELNPLFEHIASKRTNGKLILGILLGFGLLSVLFYLGINKYFLNEFPGPLFLTIISNPFFLFFIESLGESIGMIMAVLMFFVGVLFFLPAVVAGFLSGSRIRGLVSAFIITFGTYLVLILGAFQIRSNIGIDLRGWLLSFSPLIFFLTLSVAFASGYLAERLYLYTFQESREKAGKLAKIILLEKK